MLIHVIYSSDSRGREVGIRGLPSLQRGGGGLAVLPLPLTPTPHPAPAPRIPTPPSPHLPQLTRGHSPSLPPATSRSVQRYEAVGRARSPRLPRRPRHTFPTPSPAGAPSSRSRGRPAAWRFPLRSWFGKKFQRWRQLGCVKAFLRV